MALLTIPSSRTQIRNFEEIKSFLGSFGIWHDQWKASIPLNNEATDADILKAYEESLDPFMKRGEYTVADVINVHEATPDLPAIRSKFLKEHTHTEDEVRFFVDGEGLFWFNVEGEVFSLLCQAGDLISVPANSKHWFDLGETPFVKAIRIFKDKSGWIPHYTNSGIDEEYNPKYATN